MNVAVGSGPWRILHLEDSAIDAELVALHLQRAGIACSIALARTRQAFLEALGLGAYDLILADYALPDFDGISALAFARRQAADTPFIFVSGTLGEEAAVDAIKEGATDYVLKQRLSRLPLAVHCALAEARMRLERRDALEALRDSEERHRLIVESVREYAIFATDLDGLVTSWNSGAERILGYQAEQILGLSAERLFLAEARPPGWLAGEMRLALEGAAVDRQRWGLHRDGGRFWASGTVMPLRDDAGEARGFLMILADRTEWRRGEERRTLLIGELNHRVKNTLATVQSLVDQTLRTSPLPESFVEAFRARLRALARAHDLLTRENWEGATLADTAQAALAPWLGGAEPRVRYAGPALRLSPRQALVLAMAFQELATNAAKHGALSGRSGAAALTWRLEGAEAVVEWREAGGPEMREPTRRGFGSRLLGRPLASELRGQVTLEFAAAGVGCVIRFPVASFAPPA